MLLLVSLTGERAIYLALELDRSWTEMAGVNPYGGTISLDTVSADRTAGNLDLPRHHVTIRHPCESKILDAVIQSKEPIRGEPVESCKCRYFNSFESFDYTRFPQSDTLKQNCSNSACDTL